MPEKPQVDLCQLDVPAQEGGCAKTGTNDPVKRRPLADLDKFTAFSPKDWEAVQTYMDELVLYIHELENRKCK